MKKNLNIAYLNGAEGMIRRGSASSGGSGSSEDVADGWEYFDLSSIEDERKFVFLDLAKIYPVMMHAILKVDADNNHIIGNPYVYDETKHTIKCVAVFTSWDGIYIDKYGTFYDFIESSDLTEFVSSIPRITKEQFYSIE